MGALRRTATAIVILGLSCTPVAGQDSQPALFGTVDGVQISGTYYPAAHQSDGAPIVILVHGELSDRTAWSSLVPRLHDAGFATLAIDLRGHGQSGSGRERERVAARDEALFAAMDLDVWAAYDWLAQQPGVDRARFAVIGADVGASVAVRYAVLDRSVDAVVGLTPRARAIGLDAQADVAQLKGRRLLFLAATADEDEAQALAGAAEGAKAKSYKSDGRGTQLLSAGVYAERDVVEFLHHAVGRPTSTIVYGSIQKDVYHLPGSGWVARISSTNLRHYSSRDEAESRGLRASRSSGPEDVPRRRRP